MQDPRNHPDPHDRGLAFDLVTLERSHDRRRVIGWLAALAGGSTAALFGCGGGGSSSTDDEADSGSASSGGGTGTVTTGSGSVASCTVIPEETAGPYPADGSNVSSGPTSNALMLSGILRSDILNSIGGATGVASGVPLTVELHLVNTNESCADLSGYAVYLWHCDALGRYSLYSSGATGENYLRGVQQTDSAGKVSFTTIFPGCYSGRVPHIHFEIYRTPTTATSWTTKLKTTQLAFPVEVAEAVYATSGYTGSASNLSHISFATDGVFSDGVSTQLATVNGSASAGYVASLVVGFAG